MDSYSPFDISGVKNQVNVDLFPCILQFPIALFDAFDELYFQKLFVNSSFEDASSDVMKILLSVELIIR